MMFTSEQITRAMMMGRISEEEGDLALDVALAVERGITCPATGRVMDSRTALAIQVRKDAAWETQIVVDPALTEKSDWPDKASILDSQYGADAWRIATAGPVWEKIDA